MTPTVQWAELFTHTQTYFMSKSMRFVSTGVTAAEASVETRIH